MQAPTDPQTIINRINSLWKDGETNLQKAFSLLNGLSMFHSSESDVSKAYKGLAKYIHPDKCDLPGAHAAFQKLAEAKKVAKDHTERRLKISSQHTAAYVPPAGHQHPARTQPAAASSSRPPQGNAPPRAAPAGYKQGAPQKPKPPPPAAAAAAAHAAHAAAPPPSARPNVAAASTGNLNRKRPVPPPRHPPTQARVPPPTHPPTGGMQSTAHGWGCPMSVAPPAVARPW